MAKLYRVRKGEDGRYYPQFRYWLWFWHDFYYTKMADYDDVLYVRNYATEDEAWDYIIIKKHEPKFSQYDTVE